MHDEMINDQCMAQDTGKQLQRNDRNDALNPLVTHLDVHHVHVEHLALEELVQEAEHALRVSPFFPTMSCHQKKQKKTNKQRTSEATDTRQFRERTFFYPWSRRSPFIVFQNATSSPHS